MYGAERQVHGNDFTCKKETVDCYSPTCFGQLTVIDHLHAIVTHRSDPRLMASNFSLQNENKQNDWADTNECSLQTKPQKYTCKIPEWVNKIQTKLFTQTVEIHCNFFFFPVLTINAWCFFDKFWAPVKSRPVLVDEAIGSFSLIHASSSSTSWRNLLSLSASWSLAFRARRGAWNLKLKFSLHKKILQSGKDKPSKGYQGPLSS